MAADRPSFPDELAERDLDAASARLVIETLRRAQAARDGRQLSRAWKLLADRVERSYPDREEVA